MKKWFKEQENRISLAVFLVVVLIACSPLITKLCINGHDLEYHLLRIESRPIRDGSFDVMFFLDFSGKLSDPSVKAVLRDLEENLSNFRCIGTFKSE